MSRATSEACWVAGVDGCKGGWAVVLRHRASKAHRLLKVARFAELLTLDENPSVIAVDMPIGLPELAGPGGRGPENAVRPLLGMRQSSVFSVPSRAAVQEEEYGEACRVALATSDPPRKVSKQAFYLFPKIREIDALMTPALEARVFEVHPELAFWRLNGAAPMSLPKKVRNRPDRPGILQRQALLQRFGFETTFFQQLRPSGIGEDDRVDAAVCAVMAERLVEGLAQPFPPDPLRDDKGLRMAIWG